MVMVDDVGDVDVDVHVVDVAIGDIDDIGDVDVVEQFIVMLELPEFKVVDVKDMVVRDVVDIEGDVVEISVIGLIN